MDERHRPATTLRQAYQSCHPRPLRPDHPWYVDLSSAREGDHKSALTRRFEYKDPGVAGQPETWNQVLFVGLRGSGKTTELNGLRADLRHRFEVVYLEATDVLNTQEFDLSELMLALALGVERHCREFLGRPLPEAPLLAVQEWFARITREDVEERVTELRLNGGGDLERAPRPVRFLLSLQAMLKSTSTERERVVQQVRRFPAELVQLLNALLDAAGATVRAADPSRELLILFDALDRYAPRVVDDVLGSGVEHLRDLHCNLLLTPPIALVANPRSEPLDSLYQTELMHTPRLREPDDVEGAVKDPGLRVLRRLLALRVDLGAVFEDPDAVSRRLIQLSGGSPRDLMDLTRESILQAGGDRLRLDDGEAALRRRLSLLRTQVNLSGHLQRLVQVQRSGQLGEGAEFLDLLARRWVLKYNGRGWYALHPCVSAVPEVQAAVAAIRGGGG